MWRLLLLLVPTWFQFLNRFGVNMRLVGFSLGVLLFAGNVLAEGGIRFPMVAANRVVTSALGLLGSGSRSNLDTIGMLAAVLYYGLANSDARDPFGKIVQCPRGSARKRSRSETSEPAKVAESANSQNPEAPAGDSSQGAGLGGAGGHGGDGQDPNEPRKTLGARFEVSVEQLLQALQRLLQEMRTAQNLTLEQANQSVVRAEELHQQYYDAMRRTWALRLLPRFLTTGPQYADALLTEARAIRDRLAPGLAAVQAGATPQGRGTRFRR